MTDAFSSIIDKSYLDRELGETMVALQYIKEKLDETCKRTENLEKEIAAIKADLAEQKVKGRIAKTIWSVICGLAGGVVSILSTIGILIANGWFK